MPRTEGHPEYGRGQFLVAAGAAGAGSLLAIGQAVTAARQIRVAATAINETLALTETFPRHPGEWLCPVTLVGYDHHLAVDPTARALALNNNKLVQASVTGLDPIRIDESKLHGFGVYCGTHGPRTIAASRVSEVAEKPYPVLCLSEATSDGLWQLIGSTYGYPTGIQASRLTTDTDVPADVLVSSRRLNPNDSESRRTAVITVEQNNPLPEGTDIAELFRRKYTEEAERWLKAALKVDEKTAKARRAVPDSQTRKDLVRDLGENLTDEQKKEIEGTGDITQATITAVAKMLATKAEISYEKSKTESVDGSGDAVWHVYAERPLNYTSKDPKLVGMVTVGNVVFAVTDQESNTPNGGKVHEARLDVRSIVTDLDGVCNQVVTVDGSSYTVTPPELNFHDTRALQVVAANYQVYTFMLQEDGHGKMRPMLARAQFDGKREQVNFTGDWISETSLPDSENPVLAATVYRGKEDAHTETPVMAYMQGERTINIDMVWGLRHDLGVVGNLQAHIVGGRTTDLPPWVEQVRGMQLVNNVDGVNSRLFAVIEVKCEENNGRPAGVYVMKVLLNQPVEPKKYTISVPQVHTGR